VNRELVMYTRNRGCPYVSIARMVLARHAIPCREIDIDADPAAREWLLQTVGFLSVPTLVIAAPGQMTPATPPLPLPPGHSPRGVDRGSILTEPSAEQLTAWLARHGLLAVDAV